MAVPPASPSPAPLLRAALGLLALAALSALLTPPATAIQADADGTVLPAALPSPRWGMGMAWTGSVAYLFGGGLSPGMSNQIVAYDPGAGTVTVLPATLPEPYQNLAAAWTGTEAYVFGLGLTNNRIGVFDPSGPSFTLLPAPVTPPLWPNHGGAVWDGSSIWVFSGTSTWQYTPSSGILNTWPNLTGQVPAAAVWTGSEALMSTYDSDRLLRFDTATGTMSLLAPTLPLAVRGQAAVWDGEAMYVFGGIATATGAATDGMARFDPDAASVGSVTGVLPTPAAAMAAIPLDPCKAHLIGGSTVAAALATIVSVSNGGCPQADFAWSSPGVCQAVVDVTDTSTFIAEAAHAWEFGDMGAGSGPVLTYTYADPGTYTVTLEVTDQWGAVHAATGSVTPIVANCPRSPAMDDPPGARTNPGLPLHVCVTAVSGMGGPLVFSAEGLPPGATFDGPCIDWVPTEDQLGWWPCVTVTVTETTTGLSDSGCVRLSVVVEAVDTDGDGVADAADDCPGVANGGQSGCGPCADACAVPPPAPPVRRTPSGELDTDLDGIADAADNCPLLPNVAQADLDGDRTGDACDGDVDGDGTPDALDACPRGLQHGACGAPAGASAAPGRTGPSPGVASEATGVPAGLGYAAAGFVAAFAAAMVAARRFGR